MFRQTVLGRIDRYLGACVMAKALFWVVLRGEVYSQGSCTCRIVSADWRPNVGCQPFAAGEACRRGAGIRLAAVSDLECIPGVIVSTVKCGLSDGGLTSQRDSGGDAADWLDV